MITSIEDICRKVSELRRGRGNKRLRISLSLKQQIVDFLIRHPEISTPNFCQQTGISASAIRRWCKDLSPGETDQMIPVVIAEEDRAARSQKQISKAPIESTKIVVSWTTISFPASCPLAVLESITQSLSRSEPC